MDNVLQSELPFFFALVLGFTHAFEADHLAAIGNMATRRDRVVLAMKDGAFWGLGHSTTILLISVLVLLGKQHIDSGVFAIFEAGVGLMLILLGIWRLRQAWQEGEHPHFDKKDRHGAAYGIGAVHGLAGSGALLALVATQLSSLSITLFFLLLFGIGSVVGMLLAASIFSLPFSKLWLSNRKFQLG
ncbi:MAG: urease accessory protein, partial [Bacteroidota bacterium]